VEKDTRWPWWDTRVSAQTARLAGWAGVAMAAMGLTLMLLHMGDGLRFAFAVAQFGCGTALAVLHFLTRRRRLQDKAGREQTHHPT
jgi:hypothetical protein